MLILPILVYDNIYLLLAVRSSASRYRHRNNHDLAVNEWQSGDGLTSKFHGVRLFDSK